MKIPFTKSNGGAQSPASLFAALVLVALVPAVCVLWFMTVAMRNQLWRGKAYVYPGNLK